MLKKILLVLSILIAVECIVAVGKPLKGIRTSNYRFHTSRKAVLAEEHDRNDLVVAENVAFSSIEATTQQQTVTSIILGNWFVLSQFLCMGLAYLNPSIGRTGGVLKPEITVSKLGVSLIFFFNGLKISAEQLKEASSDLRINFLVLFYNLVFIPLVTRFLVAPFIPSELLRNGIIALSVLPCTINVCVTMTQAAKGNVSSAIFNAVVGNLVGVVWSPIIIYYLLGGAGSAAGGSGLSLLDTLTKLGSVVLVPLLAGQLLRLFPIDNLVKRWGNAMGVMSQVVL